MYYTNFPTGDNVNATSWHDVAIALKDLIVGATNSPWSEVTASTPTPAFLQPEASTAVAGATTFGVDHHATLYLNTDAGLNATTPHCRLFRIWIGENFLAGGIIDTRHGDPSVQTDWAFLGDKASFTDADVGTGVDTDQLYIATGNTNADATGGSPMIFRIAMWDDSLFIFTTLNSNVRGGVMIFYPASINNDQRVRDDIPFIWAKAGFYSLQNNLGWQDTNPQILSSPPFDDNPPTTSLTGTTYNPAFHHGLELSINIPYPDGMGREFVQRLQTVGITAGATMWNGFGRHIRAARKEMSVGRFNTRDIGGVEHIEYKVHDGKVYFFRNQEDPIV